MGPWRPISCLARGQLLANHFSLVSGRGGTPSNEYVRNVLPRSSMNLQFTPSWPLYRCSAARPQCPGVAPDVRRHPTVFLLPPSPAPPPSLLHATPRPTTTCGLPTLFSSVACCRYAPVLVERWWAPSAARAPLGRRIIGAVPLSPPDGVAKENGHRCALAAERRSTAPAPYRPARGGEDAGPRLPRATWWPPHAAVGSRLRPRRGPAALSARIHHEWS